MPFWTELNRIELIMPKMNGHSKIDMELYNVSFFECSLYMWSFSFWSFLLPVQNSFWSGLPLWSCSNVVNCFFLCVSSPFGFISLFLKQQNKLVCKVLFINHYMCFFVCFFLVYRPSPRYHAVFTDGMGTDAAPQISCSGDERPSQEKPFLAPVLANDRVTALDHFQDVRLVRLDISGSDIKWVDGIWSLWHPV